MDDIGKEKTAVGWTGAWKRDSGMWCVTGKSLTWNISLQIGCYADIFIQS